VLSLAADRDRLTLIGVVIVFTVAALTAALSPMRKAPSRE
jgi:hypothetical protein